MNTQKATRVLMDVDTGVDDAMALALIAASPGVELIGVTTVAGNVNRDRATINTLRVLDFLGESSVPVFAGMARPLSRVHVDATDFHGHDGLGGASLPDSTRTEEWMTAPEFIVQSARQSSGDLTLLFVGPLTNLAVALALEPKLPSMVSRTVIMGGAFVVPGNTTPTAEFNIVVDPEAARIVAESELRATWIGLDVTRKTWLHRDAWKALDGLDSPAATLIREVCRGSFEGRKLDRVHLHDPLSAGVVIDPSLVNCRESAVWVDTSIRETAGTTRMVSDATAPLNQVAVEVESATFLRLFGETLDVPVSDLESTSQSG